MLEWLNSILLAVVQGLTEFLPVSSSGHLVLTQWMLGAREGDVFFDVILHFGTLGSVVAVYRHEVRRLLRLDAPARRYILCLAVGTLPAAAAGLAFSDFFQGLFHSPVAAACGLLLTAAALFSTRWHAGELSGRTTDWTPQPVRPHRALVIGLAQALAILPGVSRSGMTITASLWLGLKRGEAARFSFLLSIPVITAALLLQVSEGVAVEPRQAVLLVLSAGAAFAVGLLALRWTALAVLQAHFWKFGIYCVLLGVVTLLILH